MRRLLAPTLLVVPLLLAGCGSDPVDVEGNWMLVGATLPEGHWNPEDPEQTRYFLQIAEATDEAGEDVGLVAKGFAGCQEYQARVEQDGDDLDFADLEVIDRPNCQADTVPDPLEGNLPGAIEAIDSAEMDGDLLVLRGPETTLTFEQRAS
jgi:hypothetical protein